MGGETKEVKRSNNLTGAAAAAGERGEENFQKIADEFANSPLLKQIQGLSQELAGFRTFTPQFKAQLQSQQADLGARQSRDLQTSLGQSSEGLGLGRSDSALGSQIQLSNLQNLQDAFRQIDITEQQTIPQDLTRSIGALAQLIGIEREPIQNLAQAQLGQITGLSSAAGAAAANAGNTASPLDAILGTFGNAASTAGGFLGGNALLNKNKKPGVS